MYVFAKNVRRIAYTEFKVNDLSYNYASAETIGWLQSSLCINKARGISCPMQELSRNRGNWLNRWEESLTNQSKNSRYWQLHMLSNMSRWHWRRGIHTSGKVLDSAFTDLKSAGSSTTFRHVPSGIKNTCQRKNWQDGQIINDTGHTVIQCTSYNFVRPSHCCRITR